MANSLMVFTEHQIADLVTFAAIINSTLLGRINTRFRSGAVGISHSARVELVRLDTDVR